MGAYGATKYAVEALSDALRQEVAGFGIDVVIIEPGFVATSLGEATDAQAGAGHEIPDAYASIVAGGARYLPRRSRRASRPSRSPSPSRTPPSTAARDPATWYRPAPDR